MKTQIAVIAPPRSGGTAYAQLLASQHKVLFVNEPFAPAFKVTPKTFKGTMLGGGVPAGNWVCHSVVSQHVEHYMTRPLSPKIELVFLERKDKWKQMLSYVTMMTLLHEHGIHNLDFRTSTPIEIRVDAKHVDAICYEWSLFYLLTEGISKTVYYEDLAFPVDFPMKKNLGYENIRILNLDYLASRFEVAWNYNPLT